MSNPIGVSCATAFILFGIAAAPAEAGTVFPGGAYVDQVSSAVAQSPNGMANAGRAARSDVQQVGHAPRQMHAPQPSTSNLQVDQVGSPATRGSIILAAVGPGQLVEQRADEGNSRAVSANGSNNMAMQHQDGAQLTSLIFQSGERNRAVTSQAGLMNYTAVVQRGGDNLAVITQGGRHAFAFVSQSGLGNFAAIRQ